MTVSSVLEQYQVADFVEWSRKHALILNPDFQRRSVWTPAAKSYLVETILEELPMPKVYIRTTINIVSQASVREVVDGQQRLRAILEFSTNNLRLTKRAGRYEGLTYEGLEDEFKEKFLSYRISVEQLVNASDDDVLQVFARLNSYTLPLTPPELRHATFQGDFKWAVRETATELAWFWTKYGTLSTRERLRMLDDSLTAEMFGILLEGVQDGGQPKITKIYERHDKNFPEAPLVKQRLIDVVKFLDTELSNELSGEFFSGSPHFLMLFAAIAHGLFGIPNGEITPIVDMPPANQRINLDVAKNNLAELAVAYSDGTMDPSLLGFVQASSGTTQRIASRRPRFVTLCKALREPL